MILIWFLFFSDFCLFSSSFCNVLKAGVRRANKRNAWRRLPNLRHFPPIEHEYFQVNINWIIEFRMYNTIVQFIACFRHGIVIFSNKENIFWNWILGLSLNHSICHSIDFFSVKLRFSRNYGFRRTFWNGFKPSGVTTGGAMVL